LRPLRFKIHQHRITKARSQQPGANSSVEVGEFESEVGEFDVEVGEINLEVGENGPDVGEKTFQVVAKISLSKVSNKYSHKRTF